MGTDGKQWDFKILGIDTRYPYRIRIVSDTSILQAITTISVNTNSWRISKALQLKMQAWLFNITYLFYRDYLRDVSFN